MSRFGLDKRNSDGLRGDCKDCIKAYTRLWQANNKDKVNRNNEKWRRNNPEKYAEVKRLGYEKWRLNNLNKRNEINARRKARVKGATVEKVDYSLIRERDGTCYLCSVCFTEGERWNTSLTHVDHKIPVSRGGEHSYENCALTHKKCNLQKHDRTPDELLGN